MIPSQNLCTNKLCVANNSKSYGVFSWSLGVEVQILRMIFSLRIFNQAIFEMSVHKTGASGYKPLGVWRSTSYTAKIRGIRKE